MSDDQRKKRKEQNEKYLTMSPHEKIVYNITGIKEELKKLNINPDFIDYNFNTDDLRNLLSNKKIKIDCGQGRSHCIECALSEIDLARVSISK